MRHPHDNSIHTGTFLDIGCGYSAASQVVFHLHVHVLPRYHNDDIATQVAARRQLVTPRSPLFPTCKAVKCNLICRDVSDSIACFQTAEESVEMVRKIQAALLLEDEKPPLHRL